jgi:hypothetical protein
VSRWLRIRWRDRKARLASPTSRAFLFSFELARGRAASDMAAGQ